jgi:hypothetical protein
MLWAGSDKCAPLQCTCVRELSLSSLWREFDRVCDIAHEPLLRESTCVFRIDLSSNMRGCLVVCRYFGTRELRASARERHLREQ